MKLAAEQKAKRTPAGLGACGFSSEPLQEAGVFLPVKCALSVGAGPISTVWSRGSRSRSFGGAEAVTRVGGKRLGDLASLGEGESEADSGSPDPTWVSPSWG
jgi:hypothetical protein